MKEIEIEDVKSKTFERSEVDEEKLKELVVSIESTGVAQPILVRPVDDGYEVVAGGRRLDSSKEAQKGKNYRLFERDLSEREALELALISNLHREDLFKC